MSDNEKFPVWKGYSSIKYEDVKNVGKLFMDEYDSLVRAFLESSMRAQYFEDILRYIQHRLEKAYDGEPIGLCLNSAEEIFKGIYIVPCEKLKYLHVLYDIENVVQNMDERD